MVITNNNKISLKDGSVHKSAFTNVKKDCANCSLFGRIETKCFRYCGSVSPYKHIIWKKI